MNREIASPASVRPRRGKRMSIKDKYRMQKKFASKSGFFDLRVLIALFVVSAGAAMALFATAIPSGLAVETAFPEGGPTPTPTPGNVLYDQYDNFSTEKTPNIPSQDAETSSASCWPRISWIFSIARPLTISSYRLGRLGRSPKWICWENMTALGRLRRFTFSFTRMAQATCQGSWLRADSRTPTRGPTIS